MDALDEISEYLLEKETITGKEFMAIFNRVKGIEETPAEPTEEIAAEEAQPEEVKEENV